MNAYAQRLVAAGIPADTAIRDAWADSVQWFNNRERYAADYAREQAQDASDYRPIPYTEHRGA